MSKDEKPEQNGGSARLSDLAYERLKKDIIFCKLKPGSEISESKLAERYGIGKSPLRSALPRLCHEGIVIALPRRGHVIAPITIRDVIDLFEVRLVSEPAAARLAAGRVDADALQRAAKACLEPFSHEDPEDIGRFLRRNSDFHRLIARFSGNRRLAEQISNLLQETERVRHIAIGALPAHQETFKQHELMIKALVDADREQAAAVTAQHIRKGWARVMSALLMQAHILDQQIDIVGRPENLPQGTGMKRSDTDNPYLARNFFEDLEGFGLRDASNATMPLMSPPKGENDE